VARGTDSLAPEFHRKRRPGRRCEKNPGKPAPAAAAVWTRPLAAAGAVAGRSPVSNYAGDRAPPVTLTREELRRVLIVAGERQRTFRDYMLILLAVSTGLREHELAALDVADVLRQDRIRRRIRLRVFKGSGRARRPGASQWVVLNRESRQQLGFYVESYLNKRAPGPLFPSREGWRLSLRQIRELWKRWQIRAGLERHHPFHRLRHTFATELLEASGGNLRLVQVAMRHARQQSTERYAHVSDERIERDLDRMAGQRG
jgi:integrase